MVLPKTEHETKGDPKKVRKREKRFQRKEEILHLNDVILRAQTQEKGSSNPAISFRRMEEIKENLNLFEEEKIV